MRDEPMVVDIEELMDYTANPPKEIRLVELEATNTLMNWFAETQDERFRVAILLARAAIKDNMDSYDVVAADDITKTY